MKKHSIAFLLGVTACLSAFSQTDSVLIEPVIVKASRLEISQQDLGRQSVILTQEDIMAHNIYSVDEALRYLGGIEVISRGPRGVQSDYSIRGANFNQILILVDGLRANDPLTGHFSSYVPTVLSHIERIEVIKGASSGLYGAEAVGGVVNIVTKKHVPESSSDFYVRLTGGRHNLKEGEVSAIGEVSRGLTIGAGLQINNTDGESYQDSLHRDFSYNTHSAFINYKPNDQWSLRFRHAYDRRDFNAQYFYTRSTFDESREEVTRLWNSLHGQVRISSSQSLDVEILHSRTTDDFVFNPAFTGNHHTTHFVNSHVRYSNQTGRLKNVFGVNYQRQDIESNDRGDHDFNRYSGYGLLHLEASDLVNIIGGLRYDYDKNIDHQFSPHLTLSLLFSDQWKGRGYVGRSIRSADFTEKYVSNNLSGPLSGGRNVGNPFLTSETAWNYELGVDYYSLSNIKMSATAFYRADRNLIDFVLTPGSEIHDPALASPADDYFYANNIASLNTYGLDFSLHATHVLSPLSKITWSGNLLLLGHSQDVEEISKNISNNSDVIAQSNVLLTSGAFSAGLTSIYKHRQEDVAETIGATLQSSYYQQNISLSNRFFDNLMTVKVDVNNLFDAQYSDILGAELPGLWWTGSLIFTW